MATKKATKTVKKAKAWVVVCDCPNGDTKPRAGGYFVFGTKKSAQRGTDDHYNIVAPCTITYELPKGKKK